MKRLLIPALALSLSAATTSCNPSAEDRKNDSLASDSQAKDLEQDANFFIDSMNRADSIARAAEADTLKK